MVPAAFPEVRMPDLRVMADGDSTDVCSLVRGMLCPSRALAKDRYKSLTNSGICGPSDEPLMAELR